MVWYSICGEVICQVEAMEEGDKGDCFGSLIYTCRNSERQGCVLGNFAIKFSRFRFSVKRRSFASDNLAL